MKGRRHTPEQVVRKLRESDRLLGEGTTVAEVVQSCPVAGTCAATGPAQIDQAYRHARGVKLRARVADIGCSARLGHGGGSELTAV